MLLSVVVDDLRARVGLVAENLPSERRFELRDDVLGEAARIGWQRFIAHDACHLPMPNGRILAARELAQACVCSRGCIMNSAAGYAIDVVKPELSEILCGEQSALGDGAQRAARRRVAELRRVGGSPDAEAVEHDEENAFDACVFHGTQIPSSSRPDRRRARYSRSRMPSTTRFS